MIGQTINNRYKITDRLGKGAMGTVYRATDTLTRQEVAIKIIAGDLVVDPEMLERFKREGEALRHLRHRNIVGFVDAFQHEESYIIVMEYVAAGSLFELLKAGPLSIDQGTQIALDLSDALISAHRLKIVHRDIKPENILIAEDGSAKLADFGVARLSEGTRMTRTGTKVGTPYYMAPEAWKGETIDAQADIWSLGVVLFEMLAGMVPFDGDSEFAVMTKVCTTLPPDLKKLRRDVTPRLVKIIRRMLTRDKNQRYQTMREVAVDLERGQQTPLPVRNTPTPSKGTYSLVRWLLGSVAMLAVLTIVALVVRQAPTLLSNPTATIEIFSTMISEKDGMILLYVPEGEFTMGSDQNFWEKPIHQIHLDAFWIDQTEVTNKHFAACVVDGGCTSPSNTGSKTRPDYYFDSVQYENYPVIYVDWNQADAYCSWAGRRLPTEAEWEKAARGTDARIYPWGNDPPNKDLLNFSSIYGDTTTAGSYEDGKSLYGAYDMAGNVSEWVYGWYSESYYQSMPSINPKGPDTGNGRILRGGSWLSPGYLVRAASRVSSPPLKTDLNIGFRCAQSITP